MPALEPLETLFLAARDACDARDLARLRGVAAAGATVDALESLALRSRRAVAAALQDFSEAGRKPDRDDVRALERIREVLRDGSASDDASSDARATAGSSSIAGAFAAAGEQLTFDGAPISRLSILARLGSTPNAEARRRLFLGLEPLWHAVDGDGSERSPYRERLRRRAAELTPPTGGGSALGLSPVTLEAWCVGILDAWRAASGLNAARPGPAHGEIEPWNWWWDAGEADRLVGGLIPVERLLRVNAAYHASLGADLDAIGVRFDVVATPSRPPIPVARTMFGSRPRHLDDGTWQPGVPWVVATYRDGRLGELTELVHETGHAIHIAAIRERPAFADWPDSDAFTEALADILAMDTTEPSWLGRWVDPSLDAIPAETTLRSRYAAVALDAAWALFELRARQEPDARPNDTWTEITSRWLGIRPHPEWSWWAIRGQLAESPGYMASYAAGAVLAAEMRAAIRTARGDWTAGDPSWYAWASERLYRFGASRASGDVLRDLLGHDPTPDALIADMGRLAATSRPSRTRP